MLSRNLFVPLLLVAAAFGGCVGGDGNGASPTPSPSEDLPPTPKVVFADGEINHCPPAAPGTGQAVVKSFTVPEGYDQIVIVYHDSGEGRVTASIASKTDAKTVWEVRDREVSTIGAAKACGDHAHSGGGENRTVEPGDFEVRIAATGVVSIHLDVTARSTRAANQTGPHSEH